MLPILWYDAWFYAFLLLRNSKQSTAAFVLVFTHVLPLPYYHQKKCRVLRAIKTSQISLLLKQHHHPSLLRLEVASSSTLSNYLWRFMMQFIKCLFLKVCHILQLRALLWFTITFSGTAVLSLGCNVGGTAIPAIKRGNLWHGLESNDAYAQAIVPFVCHYLLFTAKTFKYYTGWISCMFIICCVYAHLRYSNGGKAIGCTIWAWCWRCCRHQKKRVIVLLASYFLSHLMLTSV